MKKKSRKRLSDDEIAQREAAKAARMRHKTKREKENLELAYYYLSQCHYNLSDAKKKFRKHIYNKYNVKMAPIKLNRIFERVQQDVMHSAEPNLFKNLRMQLLTCGQDVLAKTVEDFYQNGDTQEMLDSMKFFSELAAFINNTNTTVNINQDNSQNMEMNVDELIVSLSGGMDRIGPILEKVRALGGLPGGESPFYLHPTRETKDIISLPAQRDMGVGREQKR